MGWHARHFVGTGAQSDPHNPPQPTHAVHPSHSHLYHKQPRWWRCASWPTSSSPSSPTPWKRSVSWPPVDASLPRLAQGRASYTHQICAPIQALGWALPHTSHPHHHPRRKPNSTTTGDRGPHVRQLVAGRAHALQLQRDLPLRQLLPPLRRRHGPPRQQAGPSLRPSIHSFIQLFICAWCLVSGVAWQQGCPSIHASIHPFICPCAWCLGWRCVVCASAVPAPCLSPSHPDPS